MVYSATITTPNSTTEDTKTTTILKVTRGLVYFIEVYFPPGSQGLLSFRILDGSFYLLPSTPGEVLRGDAIMFRYDDLYLKESEPFQFVIDTWNEDDKFNHVIFIHVGMVSQDVYKARFMPTVANELFKKMLEQMQTEKQAVQAQQEIIEFTILGRKRGE